jgi:hypothetical protein
MNYELHHNCTNCTTISQRTVVSTFASPHEPTLKPKAYKRASAFSTQLGKAILANAKKQNKFVLRGYCSAN